MASIQAPIVILNSKSAYVISCIINNDRLTNFLKTIPIILMYRIKAKSNVIIVVTRLSPNLMTIIKS